MPKDLKLFIALIIGLGFAFFLLVRVDFFMTVIIGSFITGIIGSLFK